MFGNHGLGGLLEEGAHGKSPKCLGGTLGDFGEFYKGLRQPEMGFQVAYLVCFVLTCGTLVGLNSIVMLF